MAADDDMMKVDVDDVSRQSKEMWQSTKQIFLGVSVFRWETKLPCLQRRHASSAKKDSRGSTHHIKRLLTLDLSQKRRFWWVPAQTHKRHRQE
jgi:hypothetical protein